MNNTRNRFSPEVRERAVRMVGEHRADCDSEWEAMTSIASKVDCTAETLRRWCRTEAGFRKTKGRFTLMRRKPYAASRILRRSLAALSSPRVREIVRAVLFSLAFAPTSSTCAALREEGSPPTAGIRESNDWLSHQGQYQP